MKFCGQDGATRVNHHPEGVPPAPANIISELMEGGAGSGKAPPVDEGRGRAAATELFLFDEANGLLRFGEIMTEQA